MTAEEHIASIKKEISDAGLILREWDMLESPNYSMSIQTPAINGIARCIRQIYPMSIKEDEDAYLFHIRELWYAAKYNHLDTMVNAE